MDGNGTCQYEFMVFSTVDTEIGEGNGNPLQSSCLENPMGRRESDTTEVTKHAHTGTQK